MSKPERYKIHVAFFAYGGNGGIHSEIPEIREWWAGNLIKLLENPLIGKGSVSTKTYSDTPITMTRNQAVLDARAKRADFLLMIDSDNQPDLYLGKRPEASPFLPDAIKFLDAHYEKGPALIGAPYCGCPPHPVKGGEENIYVFRWSTRQTNHENPIPYLDQFTRYEAAMLAGIHPCDAIATGCILFDMRCFDLTEPRDDEPYFKGWFYYEWENKYAAQKASTEDCTSTRDMILAGAKGYCHWNAWAGHMKPRCVGKPFTISSNEISDRLKNAVMENVRTDAKYIDIESAMLMKGENGFDLNGIIPLTVELGEPEHAESRP